MAVIMRHEELPCCGKAGRTYTLTCNNCKSQYDENFNLIRENKSDFCDVFVSVIIGSLFGMILGGLVVLLGYLFYCLF